MKVELWLGPQDGAILELSSPLPSAVFVPRDGKLDGYVGEAAPLDPSPLRRSRYERWGVRPGGRKIYRYAGEEPPL